MAITTDLQIYRGESRSLFFVVSPVTDITDWTLEFNLSRSKNSTTQVLTKSCTILDAPSGTFRCDLTSDETEALLVGNYFWDVWRTDAGYHRVAGIGKFTIIANVRIPA